MKRLIVDIYRIVFRLTGVKLFALIFALVYMTALNIIMIYGLGLLTKDWLSFMAIIPKLFSFPYYFVTSIAVLGITFWLMPSFQSIAKEGKKESSPLALILYTVFSLMLFMYIRMGDKIF